MHTVACVNISVHDEHSYSIAALSLLSVVGTFFISIGSSVSSTPAIWALLQVHRFVCAANHYRFRKDALFLNRFAFSFSSKLAFMKPVQLFITFAFRLCVRDASVSSSRSLLWKPLFRYFRLCLCQVLALRITFSLLASRRSACWLVV